jgi:hypothetical protein
VIEARQENPDATQLEIARQAGGQPIEREAH